MQIKRQALLPNDNLDNHVSIKKATSQEVFGKSTVTHMLKPFVDYVYDHTNDGPSVLAAFDMVYLVTLESSKFLSFEQSLQNFGINGDNVDMVVKELRLTGDAHNSQQLLLGWFIAQVVEDVDVPGLVSIELFCVPECLRGHGIGRMVMKRLQADRGAFFDGDYHILPKEPIDDGRYFWPKICKDEYVGYCNTFSDIRDARNVLLKNLKWSPTFLAAMDANAKDKSAFCLGIKSCVLSPLLLCGVLLHGVIPPPFFLLPSSAPVPSGPALFLQSYCKASTVTVSLRSSPVCWQHLLAINSCTQPQLHSPCALQAMRLRSPFRCADKRAAQRISSLLVAHGS